jgi:hypothetical protein
MQGKAWVTLWTIEAEFFGDYVFRQDTQFRTLHSLFSFVRSTGSDARTSVAVAVKPHPRQASGHEGAPMKALVQEMVVNFSSRLSIKVDRRTHR